MSIEFSCDCRASIRVSNAKAGKSMRCPECGETVTVPSGGVRAGSEPVKRSVRFLGGHYKPIGVQARLIVTGVGLVLLAAAAALILTFDRAAPIRLKSLIASAVLLSLALILLLVAATGHTVDLEETVRQQQLKESSRKKRKR